MPPGAAEMAAPALPPCGIANPIGEVAIQGNPLAELPARNQPFTPAQQVILDQLARDEGLIKRIVALGTRNGHPDPEGLAQDAFLRTARVVNPTNLKAYAYTTATHLCIDYFRRVSTRRTVLVDPVDMATFGDAEHPHANVASRLALHSLMSCLNPKQRRVLDAVVFRDLTTEQAADELGMPAGTIKAHKRNALAALRRAMTRQGLQREDLTA